MMPSRHGTRYVTPPNLSSRFPAPRSSRKPRKRFSIPSSTRTEQSHWSSVETLISRPSEKSVRPLTRSPANATIERWWRCQCRAQAPKEEAQFDMHEHLRIELELYQVRCYRVVFWWGLFRWIGLRALQLVRLHG